MCQKEEEFEKQFENARNEVTWLHKRNFVLEELLEETKRKNVFLTECLTQKDMEISHLKSEVAKPRCENKSLCKQK